MESSLTVLSQKQIGGHNNSILPRVTVGRGNKHEETSSIFILIHFPHNIASVMEKSLS